MMRVDQSKLDSTDLIVLVSREGHIEWSSHRSDAQVVAMLRALADDIENRSTA
jgi:hypothetical protein